MKTFVTFGFCHRHEVNGKIFDKDCVAVVNGGREKVFEIFETNSALNILKNIGMKIN